LRNELAPDNEQADERLCDLRNELAPDNEQADERSNDEQSEEAPMSGHDHDGAARLLRLIARKLEEYLDGDDLALETLAEALEQEGASPDDVQTAVLGIRGLAGAAPPGGWVAGFPDGRAPRVLSAEERDSLTTEAWGYLLDLRSNGALDSDQFERVLEVLTTFDERPVAVERAREVAARVALEAQDGTLPGEYPYGDQEVAH
jgi:uncharacterized protein Smg (DUF494 family)